MLNEWRATLGKGSSAVSQVPIRKGTGKRGSALALSILSSITGSFSNKNGGMEGVGAAYDMVCLCSASCK